MSKLQNSETDPVTDLTATSETTDTPETSVGVRLREARESKQLELRDVALKTRQSQETLAALEAEDTDHIPTSILRLQARNYARFLGLPEADIVSAFSEGQSTINAGSMPAQSKEFRFPTKALMFGGGVLAALALIASGISMMASSSSQTETDPLAISARLAPAFDREAGLVALSSDVSEEFSIRASQQAWIEVRGSDGTVFRSRQMQAGETYFPRTGAGWTITVRDAGAFEWLLGETPAGQIGEAGQALYSLSIDNALETVILDQSPALADAGTRGRERR